MMVDALDLPELLTAHREAQAAIRTTRAALAAAQDEAVKIRAACRNRLLYLGLDDADILALVGVEPGPFLSEVRR